MATGQASRNLRRAPDASRRGEVESPA